MHPRVKHRCINTACDKLEAAALNLMESAHPAAANLERLGVGGATDMLDRIVHELQALTRLVRAAAEVDRVLATQGERRSPNLDESGPAPTSPGAA